jgi:hypothetical protein
MKKIIYHGKARHGFVVADYKSFPIATSNLYCALL